MKKTCLSLFIAIPLITSCGESKEEKLSNADMELLYGASEGPLGFWLGAQFIFGFLGGFEVECPKITSTETSMTVEGGCTDDEGQTWTGSYESDSTGTTTWTDFDFGGIVLDGKQTLDATGTLTSNMTITGTMDSNSMSGGPENIEATYTNHRVTNVMAVFAGSWADEPTPYSYTVSGSVELNDMGSFAINSTVDQAGECELEMDSGSTEMVGEFTVVFSPNGAEDCDGCVPWTSGDQSGTVCNEVSDGDTGAWDTGSAWDTGW